jgi:predicted CXXCH cytochrome family protein
MLAVLVLGLFLFQANTEAAAIKTVECLECHETYRDARHSDMSCSDCHSSITSLPHAERLPKPICATCHRKTVEAFDHGIHRGKGLECSQCHNTHMLNKDRRFCVSCHGLVAHTKLPSSAEHLSVLTCTACHGNPERMNLTVYLDLKQNRGPTRAQIDRNSDRFVSKEEWHALGDLLKTEYRGTYDIKRVFRVESDDHAIGKKPVGCAKCHSPQGQFASALLQVKGSEPFSVPMDLTVFVPDLPSEKEFDRTVHGKKGVTCADCHLSQNRFAEGWSENSMVCVKCHENVQTVYKNSLHSKNGATHCVDCHNPHRIKSYKDLTASERVAVCSRCHSDYLRKHGWLPNTALHFSYLECATCHSPRSAKSMIYYFARNEGGKKSPLTYSQLAALYGSDPLKQIAQDNPGTSVDEKSGRSVGRRQGVSSDEKIGRLFSVLHDRDKRVIIDASILVTNVYHDYSETRLKEKECITCHSGEAAFYKSMFFFIPGKTAPSYVPVKGGLLSSYPLAGIVDFFLLGEDKIRRNDFVTLFGKEGIPRSSLGFKIIDFIALLLIFLMLVAIAVHVILRLAVRR